MRFKPERPDLPPPPREIGKLIETFTPKDKALLGELLLESKDQIGANSVSSFAKSFGIPLESSAEERLRHSSGKLVKAGPAAKQATFVS